MCLPYSFVARLKDVLSSSPLSQQPERFKVPRWCNHVTRGIYKSLTPICSGQTDAATTEVPKSVFQDKVETTHLTKLWAFQVHLGSRPTSLQAMAVVGLRARFVLNRFAF
jgi:hypothetical protein